MKLNNNYTLCFFLVVLALFLGACSKMNDLHQEYLDRGETIYVGKPDSVLVFAGKKRVKLRYWTSDPKAIKMVIYWKSRTDSLVLDVPSHPAKDPVDVFIENLPEYNYSFEIFTMNKDFKNRSVAFQTSGSAYGDDFQASLRDRAIESSKLLTVNGLEIKWLNAVEKASGTEVVYINTSGNTVTRFVPMEEKITLISDFDRNAEYRTLFLPEEKAIDVFSTPLKAITVDMSTEMSNTLFKKWNPTGIPYSEVSTTVGITKLWDKLTTTYYTQTVPGFPYSFTFDLGETAKLIRFTQWHQLTTGILYRKNVKTFEIWGSATPDVDAGFNGWVKLGDYESRKPSGLPFGQEVAGDIAFATAGENFTVNPGAPAVRYIRYVIKDTWDGATGPVTIAEMAFFKSVR